MLLFGGCTLVLGFALGMLIQSREQNESSTPFEMVRDFHHAYGQPVGREPLWPTADRLELRVRLIDEEVAEFKDAIAQNDLVNAFKELADIQYVVNGAAIEMGGNLDNVFSEVHNSNMSKLDENGKPIYREDGKVLKGPNYRTADVTAALGLK
jgi:predicted HAD superfamily Cof-like phosphohydrolase